MFFKRAQRPRIKIVTLAKNEALFLTDWVYHHFYFGIDAIDIHVNRTEDNTDAVLDILSSKYKNLNVYNADAYDKVLKQNVNLQMLVYANSYYNNKDFDYIMHIDLDEYYYPRNGRDSIGKMLAGLDFPEHLLLEWFCINGQSEYAHPLEADCTHKGHISQLGKSILKTGLDIRQFYPHMPEFNANLRSCLADGKPVENDSTLGRQFLNEDLQNGFKDYFLVHDWMKSPALYLASLYNGSANRDKNQDGFKKLKSNRPVYNLNVGKNITSATLPVEATYLTGLRDLWKNKAIRNELVKAKIFKFQQALCTLEILIRYKDEILARNAIAAFGPLEDVRDRIFVELIRTQESA